ncbi:MAG: hypothetical protein P8M32_09890 [Phycisphaerales bacterium]|nr:hypothetical protein [Phycisphaerales bacterium]
MNATKDQHRADQIFAEALDRPPSSRAAFIEATCGEDEQLREEVNEMLAHYAYAEDALTKTRTTHRISGRPEIEQVDIRTDTGRTVGTCKLDGKLPDDGLFERWGTRRQGEGPAAVLSLARQRLSLDDARQVGLHAEMLLRLDHPGLPQVLEAGTVDLGRGSEAFFLVERIDGEPIADSPATSTGDLRRRIEHLVPLCEALQELHFHGLFHGRLTPSRIITQDKGEWRLSDPGLLASIARAIPDSAAAEKLRDYGGAPERPVMSPLSLDGRIDVFDLGRLLNIWIEGHDGSLAIGLRAIANRATAHDRQERYRSAGEFGDHLKSILTPSTSDGDLDDSLAGLTSMAATILIAVTAAAAFALGVALDGWLF